jgi:hypothetical protein
MTNLRPNVGEAGALWKKVNLIMNEVFKEHKLQFQNSKCVLVVYYPLYLKIIEFLVIEYK